MVVLSGLTTQIQGHTRGGAGGVLLPYQHSSLLSGEMMVTVLDDKPFFPWGCKVYPSGEFVLWRKKREKTERQKESIVCAATWLFGARMLDSVQEVWGAEAVHMYWKMAAELGVQRVRPYPASPVNACPVDGWRWLCSDLGLSALANSQKARRGLGGLTRHGATMVREAATGMETRYGRENLSFWTCTLPPLSADDTKRVCEGWSGILHNLKEKLLYHLEKAGLPPHVVGVTEMQQERYEKEKYPAWHIHWVFVGRHPFRSWAFTPRLLERLWQEAVENVCTSQYSFRSACNVQRVEKSVGGYLAKYLGKGSAIESVKADVGPWAVPFSWYICTAALKKWVKQNTRSSAPIARWVYQLIQSIPHELKGLWAFCLESRPGSSVAVCWLGRIPDPYPPRVPLP